MSSTPESSTLCTPRPSQDSSTYSTQVPKRNLKQLDLHVDTSFEKRRHKPSILSLPENRWSELIPPETALTFAAIWDPLDGMITFSGPELTDLQDQEEQEPVNPQPRLYNDGGHGFLRPPADAPDNYSQVLTIDALGLDHSGLNTATLAIDATANHQMNFGCEALCDADSLMDRYFAPILCCPTPAARSIPLSQESLADSPEYHHHPQSQHTHHTMRYPEYQYTRQPGLYPIPLSNSNDSDTTACSGNCETEHPEVDFEKKRRRQARVSSCLRLRFNRQALYVNHDQDYNYNYKDLGDSGTSSEEEDCWDNDWIPDDHAQVVPMSDLGYRRLNDGALKSAFTMTSTSTSRYIHVGSMSILDQYGDPGARPESGISNWEQVEPGQYPFFSSIRSSARKLLKPRPHLHQHHPHDSTQTTQTQPQTRTRSHPNLHTPYSPSPLRSQMEQEVELEDYTTTHSRLSTVLGTTVHHLSASGMLNRLRSLHRCRRNDESERWVSIEIKQVVTQHLL